MRAISPAMEVDNIARIWPGTRMVFTRHNLDLCSGGVHPLEFVVKKHGLNLDSVLAELNAACETSFPVLQEQSAPCAHPRADGGPGISEGEKETTNLINAGCAGRVVFQILSDFAPSVAYPLVGLTGFIEFAALAWRGIDLWHSMNLAKTIRPKLLGMPVNPVAT